MKKFTDISSFNYQNQTIIIDVDGTLVPDKKETVESGVLDVIKKLSQTNKVFICSNGSPLYAEKIANMTGVGSFRCFKPFDRGISKTLGQLPRVVVGDKYLTDGLFALNIGAQFLRIDHFLSQTDSVFAKFSYLLDDTVWSIKNYLTLMRPWQWIKNLLVIAPVFFAGGLQDSLTLWNVLLATIIFSIFSSLTYVINDIFDLENDRQHPTKKNRPLASGLVNKTEAVSLAIFIFLVGLISLSYLKSVVPIVLIYFVSNIIYSLWLKNIAIIDAIFVAFCFVLRILAGGFATGVYISPWIVSCVFFGALFIIFGKRKGEFSHSVRRKVLNDYSEKSLDILFALSGITTLVVYSIWSVLGHGSALLIYSTVFVAIALFRMMNLVYKRNELSETPEVLVFRDKTILVSFLVWFVYVSLVFYLSIIS